MRSRSLLALALAAVLSAAVAARPLEAARNTLGERGVEQQNPIERVRELLNATHAITVFDYVTASAVDGLVTLTGKVTSKAKREQLETEVATVPGVRQVVNRIEVLSASAADDALRRRVARAIYGHASFKRYAAMTHPPIRVLVDDGRVTLAGEVASAVDRLIAVSLAQDAAGSKVEDQLRSPAL